MTSVSGLPTDGGVLCFDWANPLDTAVAEYIEYTGISGNTLTGVIRGVEGISAKAHQNGAVVAGIISRMHIKRVRDKLTGNDATLVQDPNANELIKTSYVASAVNEVTVANAATGANPTVSATGGDTNIGLDYQAKGTGSHNFKGTSASSAEVRLFEDTDNGSNYMGLKAPAAVTANVTLNLPDGAGTSGYVLSTNGVDTLSWVSVTGTADGWTTDSTHTWTYASASSFTISGVDLTATFQAGTKLRFKQGGGYKYADVSSSSFSTNTTVNIIVNTDYVIANSAISDNYYSYQDNPQGFPAAFAYTTTPTGHTGGTILARYATQGRRISFSIYYSGSGTGSTTAWTLTLPVTAATVTGNTWTIAINRTVDAGAFSTTNDFGEIASAAGSIVLLKGNNASGWTGSGNRSTQFQGWYEF